MGFWNPNEWLYWKAVIFLSLSFKYMVLAISLFCATLFRSELKHTQPRKVFKSHLSPEKSFFINRPLPWRNTHFGLLVIWLGNVCYSLIRKASLSTPCLHLEEIHISVKIALWLGACVIPWLFRFHISYYFIFPHRKSFFIHLLPPSWRNTNFGSAGYMTGGMLCYSLIINLTNVCHVWTGKEDGQMSMKRNVFFFFVYCFFSLMFF